jgi:hypothetical protein
MGALKQYYHEEIAQQTEDEMGSYPYQLWWKFRNGHKWTKQFRTLADRDMFVNRCGLLSHQDIVEVYSGTTADNNGIKPTDVYYFKREQA